MTFKTGSIQTSDAGRVEALLARCFPTKEGGSFYDDFPLWRQGGQAAWLEYNDGTHVLGCAGMLPGVWQWPDGGGLLKVVRIGGVATDAEIRGQGVAGRLVEALLVEARKLGAQAAVLWGMESPLYSRLGFAGRGIQLRIPLAQLELEASRSPGQLRLELGWDPSILPLMQRARIWAGGILLTETDAAWLAEHKNTQWARVVGSDGRTVAYGAFGRGMDLGYQLHDWWGEGEALQMILRWARGLDPQAEIMGPGWALEERLGRLPAQLIEETACMILPLGQSVLPAQEADIWFWGLDGV